MAVPTLINRAKGLWRGKSLLNLPFMPPGEQITESDSTLRVETDANDTYATVTYDWMYEGKRETGTILICQAKESSAVEFGWVDSWHQSGAVMHLVGEVAENGTVEAKGTYPAGEEVWGWTIAFSLSGNEFTMDMVNVAPKGSEWAVKASYQPD